MIVQVVSPAEIGMQATPGLWFKVECDEIYGAQGTQASAWVKSYSRHFSTKRLLGNVASSSGVDGHTYK
ncbi:MAG TPA: hypothetical protein VLC30_12785 [Pseudomonas sp.]|nr:hypothetical protein [Pseudomonas sp.]